MTPQNDRSPDTARLYAWLSRDADGIEGVVAVPTRDGVMPLVAADEARARRFAPLASVAAQARGFSAHLVAFERLSGPPLAEVPPRDVPR